MNILIVGAGPTGLTAALELYRRGFSPRIIDKKEAPSPLSRAVGINAHSLDLLEASGVTAELLKRGHKMQSVNLHENGKVIGKIHMDRLPHRFNFLLALPQNETEGVMIEALEGYGGTVEFNSRMTGYEVKDGKAFVSINEGAAEEFDLVIAADGSHSRLREAAGISFDGYDYKTRWSIADFESKDWDGIADLFLLPEGRIRFVVIIGEHRFRAVSNEPEALPGIPAVFHVDELHRADDFVISIRQAQTYQKPPLYLAGDAAHVHSPAGGRGMNMGIADACELARRIAENDLDGYTAARHPVGEKWIKTSERMVQAATSKSLLARLLRYTILAVITALPVLQVPFLKRVSGLVN